jgi:hypothetical protein
MNQHLKLAYDHGVQKALDDAGITKTSGPRIEKFLKRFSRDPALAGAVIGGGGSAALIAPALVAERELTDPVGLYMNEGEALGKSMLGASGLGALGALIGGKRLGMELGLLGGGVGAISGSLHGYPDWMLS